MGEKNVDESMDKNVGAAVKKTALKAMKKKQLPCGKKKSNRVSIFSPWRNRMVSVLDGFERAKIGVLRRAAQEDIVVYDYDLCVAILQERP